MPNNYVYCKRRFAQKSNGPAPTALAACDPGHSTGPNSASFGSLLHNAREAWIKHHRTRLTRLQTDHCCSNFQFYRPSPNTRPTEQENQRSTCNFILRFAIVNWTAYQQSLQLSLSNIGTSRDDAPALECYFYFAFRNHRIIEGFLTIWLRCFSSSFDHSFCCAIARLRSLCYPKVNRY